MRIVRFLLLVFPLLGANPDSVGQQNPSPVQRQANPFRDLKGKTVLLISPHPDDDIIGCGGALAYLSGRENHLVVVFLTSGELGTLDPAARAETINGIRRKEAAAAYKTLGFSDAELIWLGYGDGELDFAPLREIQVRLVEIIRKRRPEVAFALDPGFTYVRHHYHDHRSAALLSADAFGAARWPLQYPQAGPAFRVPDVYYFYTAEPNLQLDITEVYERKLAALAQHRSQFPPAVNHYTADGPSPSRADLENLIRTLTGGTTQELLRHR